MSWFYSWTLLGSSRVWCLANRASGAPWDCTASTPATHIPTLIDTIFALCASGVSLGGHHSHPRCSCRCCCRCRHRPRETAPSSSKRRRSIHCDKAAPGRSHCRSRSRADGRYAWRETCHTLLGSVAFCHCTSCSSFACCAGDGDTGEQQVAADHCACAAAPDAEQPLDRLSSHRHDSQQTTTTNTATTTAAATTWIRFHLISCSVPSGSRRPCCSSPYDCGAYDCGASGRGAAQTLFLCCKGTAVRALRLYQLARTSGAE